MTMGYRACFSGVQVLYHTGMGVLRAWIGGPRDNQIDLALALFMVWCHRDPCCLGI